MQFSQFPVSQFDDPVHPLFDARTGRVKWAYYVSANLRTAGTTNVNMADFKLLYGYSTVHDVKVGTQYPATLVFTTDHDDRVAPMHSFTFISD